MKPRTSALFVCLAALAAAAGQPAAEPPKPPKPPELPVGEVHQVLCDDQGKVSYHCYVPKGYDPRKRYPVLYGFPPADGGGEQAAERWAPVAEKYGWVVAYADQGAAGNLKPDALKAHAQAVFASVGKRIAAQPGRNYATGFAAGARRAVAVARLFPDRFAGVLVVGGLQPRVRAEHPKSLAVFAVAGNKDPALRELRYFKERFEKAGIPFQLRSFDGGHAPAPSRLLDEGARWLTRTWYRLHDDPSPEGRRERLAAAKEMLDGIRKQLERGERAAAYDDAVKFREIFAKTTHDRLKALLADAARIVAELEKDPSVAGLKAYKPVPPAQVIKAFAKAIEANAALDPKAKAAARAALAPAVKNPAAGQEAMLSALGALHPAFQAALGAFDNEDPGAVAAFAKLHASPDPWLAAHAAYFEGRALMMAERYEDALPLLAKVAGEWIGRTLFAGESLFLVGACQAELLNRKAAANVLRDFLKHYPDAPERMRVGADHVVRTLAAIEEGSLVDVQERMDDSRRRLSLARSGEPTQERQKRIVAMLDRLIEEAEEREQGGGGGGCGGGGGGGQGGAPSGNQVPGGPANSSSAPGGRTRIGALDRATRGRPDEVWGNARQREREKILNVLKAKFPDRYRELLEQYYKSLQESGGR